MRRASVRAFTLIEVLSVIAIVAFLAALLFPVVKKAKERAKTTASMSNLRQIYVALQLYALDSEPNATSGTASDMGIPPSDMMLVYNPALFPNTEGIWKSACDHHPLAPESFTNYSYYPANDGTFPAYSRKYKGSAIWLTDFNCNPASVDIYADFEEKFAIGLRADGSITTRTHYTSAASIETFWH